MVVWHPHDQAILSTKICYLSIEAIGMVMMATTSCEAWEIVAATFSLQSTVRTVQVHGALQKVKKLDSIVANYFNKVKQLVDMSCRLANYFTLMRSTPT
jgi:hypothetical protein